MKPLEGLKVLELARILAGPWVGQLLADLGADVVKVEPVTGEWQRHVAAGGARGNKVNVSFLSLNRNKRSLAVDL
ncbi:MAG: CoA transferase, partial [Microvirga sp.]